MSWRKSVDETPLPPDGVGKDADGIIFRMGHEDVEYLLLPLLRDITQREADGSGIVNASALDLIGNPSDAIIRRVLVKT